MLRTSNIIIMWEISKLLLTSAIKFDYSGLLNMQDIIHIESRERWPAEKLHCYVERSRPFVKSNYTFSQHARLLPGPACCQVPEFLRGELFSLLTPGLSVVFSRNGYAIRAPDGYEPGSFGEEHDPLLLWAKMSTSKDVQMDMRCQVAQVDIHSRLRENSSIEQCILLRLVAEDTVLVSSITSQALQATKSLSNTAIRSRNRNESLALHDTIKLSVNGDAGVSVCKAHNSNYIHHRFLLSRTAVGMRGFEEIGCAPFESERNTDRTLTERFYAPLMVPETCGILCYKRLFPCFFVSRETCECRLWCDSIPCRSRTAGRVWHAYKMDAMELQKVSYVACVPRIRLMSEVKHISGSLEPALCLAFCSRLGFSWSFLTNETNCICSHSSSLLRYRIFNNCFLPCPGHPEFSCGGRLSASLYRVPVDVDVRTCMTIPVLLQGKWYVFSSKLDTSEGTLLVHSNSYLLITKTYITTALRVPHKLFHCSDFSVSMKFAKEPGYESLYVEIGDTAVLRVTGMSSRTYSLIRTPLTSARRKNTKVTVVECTSVKLSAVWHGIRSIANVNQCATFCLLRKFTRFVFNNRSCLCIYGNMNGAHRKGDHTCHNELSEDGKYLREASLYTIDIAPADQQNSQQLRLPACVVTTRRLKKKRACRQFCFLGNHSLYDFRQTKCRCLRNRTGCRERTVGLTGRSTKNSLRKTIILPSIRFTNQTNGYFINVVNIRKRDVALARLGGSVVVLNCLPTRSATTWPVVWSKNAETLDGKQNSLLGSSLVLQDVKSGDSGYYRCMDRTPVTLLVYTVPQMELEVTLRWNATCSSDDWLSVKRMEAALSRFPLRSALIMCPSIGTRAVLRIGLPQDFQEPDCSVECAAKATASALRTRLLRFEQHVELEPALWDAVESEAYAVVECPSGHELMHHGYRAICVPCLPGSASVGGPNPKCSFCKFAECQLQFAGNSCYPCPLIAAFSDASNLPKFPKIVQFSLFCTSAWSALANVNV